MVVKDNILVGRDIILVARDNILVARKNILVARDSLVEWWLIEILKFKQDLFLDNIEIIA